MSSIHDGHRERLKTRFCDEGLDNFQQHEVLELLMYYALPRNNTNPIAHELINTFGSLSQVLEANVEELVQIKGVGQHVAVLIKLVTEMGRYYAVNRREHIKILETLDDCGAYLLPHFVNRTTETVFLLSLDAKRKVLSCMKVGEGSINSANVSIRRIVEIALASKASSVVLAHNHPSGIAVPSKEDIATTRRVAVALSMVDVRLADHIIFADDDYVSLVQSGDRFDDCVVI